MRSVDWLSLHAAAGRLLPWLRSLRRWLLDRPPAARWALAAAAILAVAAACYLGSPPLSISGGRYLGSGRSYSLEDLNRIGRALDRQRISYRVDDQRRVVAPLEQSEEAEAVVAKLELGPRLPGEIRDQSATPSLWESPRDKEQREQQEQARILEAMINDLPGVVGSFVWINRPRTRLGLKPAARPTAFVQLVTDGDRQLRFQTIQAITTILTGYESGLASESVTVVDRRGHKYLDAGNPVLSVLSHNRAREEDLSQQILDQLDWIKGVRVSVQLPDRFALEPGAAGSLSRAVATASPTPPAQSAHPRAAAPGADAPAPTPVVAVNRPLGSIESHSAPVPPPAAQPPGRESPSEPGRVWVKVPRSYYYHVSMIPGHREPSQEDLQKLAVRVEEQIRTGVGLVVPLSGPSAWKTTIHVIPDETPLNRPAVAAAAPSEASRLALDLGIAAAVGALAFTLASLGAWMLNARRPSRRPALAAGSVRFHVGTPGAGGPTERVREFVRRNPDSAVRVLERWSSQGSKAP